MTRLAHLSDLHFGTVPDGLAVALLDDLDAVGLDAAVIAGDLTMRARSREYTAAKEWLEALAVPGLVIPGNHDLPTWQLVERFRSPYKRFHGAVHVDRQAPLDLGNCSVFGLNTTGRWQPHMQWQEGRVRRRDIAGMATLFAAAPEDRFRIVAAHHPFSRVPSIPAARPVRRAEAMLELFSRNRVGMILSGHLHRSFVMPLTRAGKHMIAVGAPTALSTRQRGEGNGYWIVDVSESDVTLTLRRRHGEEFTDDETHTFTVTDGAIQLG